MINVDIPGWMRVRELQWLERKAARMKSILEVGSWFGRSTFVLAGTCPGPVYAVDTFAGSTTEMDSFNRMLVGGKNPKTEFLKNVGMFKNLTLIEKDSIEASTQFKDHSIDMVFIDGDHAYEFVKRDLTAWFTKARKLFCGHDRHWPGVKQALEEASFAKYVVKGTKSIWMVNIEELNYGKIRRDPEPTHSGEKTVSEIVQQSL